MVKPTFIDSNGMKKGAWSKEEDNKLKAYILRYGHWNWRLLPKYAGLTRCGKSCRLRWVNYLKPGVKKGNFTKQEEDLIVELHTQLGNKWSAIATKLPGRTDNEVKNFWHTRIKKRRMQNPVFKKVDDGHIREASSKDHEFEGVKPSQVLTNSSGSSTPLFHTNPSDSNLTNDSQVDFWNDIFMPNAQNDYNIFSPLPEQEFFYHGSLHYSELSSSDSSCLSVLDWVADDDQSIHSSDYVAQPVHGNLWTETFASHSSGSQSESSYISPQEVGELGGVYDPFLQYFNHGMDLFS